MPLSFYSVPAEYDTEAGQQMVYDLLKAGISGMHSVDGIVMSRVERHARIDEIYVAVSGIEQTLHTPGGRLTLPLLECSLFEVEIAALAHFGLEEYERRIGMCGTDYVDKFF